jgi:hypothetical protein
MTDLCEYIPRGPFKSLYQLKPEYKATVRRAAEAAASASSSSTSLHQQNSADSNS